MKYLQAISIYYWSANHLALQLKQSKYSFTEGHFSVDVDEDENPIKEKTFRALGHREESPDVCTTKIMPTKLKDFINSWFDNKKSKELVIVDNYWEDCNNYLRDDQIEMLKALFQLLVEFHAFDDDEDFEDEYDDDIPIEQKEQLQQFGVDVRSGSEKREIALKAAREHELLKSLTNDLEMPELSPLDRKYLLLNFVDDLKKNNGLAIDLSDNAEEEIMYGKSPLKKWVLPLGNSLCFDPENDDYRHNLNLFGIHAIGVKTGANKFADPTSIVHKRENKTYYKYYSRYHNCSGYVRFMLEQGGIAAFRSTNELERFGVTDPEKYEQFMKHIEKKIYTLNSMARELMVNAGVEPVPLESIESNYLAELKKGNEHYSLLPATIQHLLEEYNKQVVSLSYEHKIQLLITLVTKMHEQKISDPMVIDALQKEVRRNYSIPFDAQFSHNHFFQLNALAACAAISFGALVVGIIAIAFPALIPLFLAAAIVTTAVATAATAGSVTLFGIKSRTKKPESPEEPLAPPKPTN